MTKSNAYFLLFSIWTMLIHSSCEKNEVTMSTPSVQERLNAGETAQNLFEDFDFPIDSLIGKHYQGGVITFINRVSDGTALFADFNSFGIISAKELLGPVSWGCTGIEMGDIYNGSLFNGSENTANIAMNCDEPNIAAKLANEYKLGEFDDWFLPSLIELKRLNLSLDNFSNFPMEPIWTSTERTNETAYSLNYKRSIMTMDRPKSEENYVLPIRWF